MALVQCPGDDHQVGDENAPTDPSLEAIQIVIEATPQLHRALHDTDPAFNAIAKALPFLEPTLLFMGLALFRPRAGLGQSYLLDAELLRQAFVLRGKHAPVSS